MRSRRGHGSGEWWEGGAWSALRRLHRIFLVIFESLNHVWQHITAFSSEWALHIRWPKYWSFSFSISPSSDIQGWFPLGLTGLIFLQSKASVKSFLQHHSSKAPILRCSAFLMIQLSHSYVTTGKTITLTIWTFVGKVMSLLFNMLPGLVIGFLSRNKHLLISWL